jgi:hypothetical protein
MHIFHHIFDGQTARGKTVHPPPPSGSGGIIRSKGSNGESCKAFRTIPKSQAGTKRLCFGRSIQKFLNMSDNNSSLPKSGPPVSIQWKEASSRLGETPSARTVAVRTSIRQRGFSEKATKRIYGAVRQSTGAL